MHLGMSKSKNSTSLYVLKSTYNNGFHSTKIVEKLGTVEELRKRLNGRDPIEWAKEHIKELNELEKEEKREVMDKYSPVKQIEKGERRTFNGGYLFLQKCYSELGLSTLCASLKKKHHLDFDLDAVFSRLIYARILQLNDDDYFDQSMLLIEQPNFTREQVRTALSVLAEEEDTIRRFLYENTRKLYGKGNSRLYYTSSICLYETGRRDGMNMQVVPMELYYDSNSIPIGYTINPDHEPKPFVNANEEDVRREFAGIPTISIGDAGFISAATPTFKDWGNINRYMTIVPYRKFHDLEKKQADDPSHWYCNEQEGTFSLDEIRAGSETEHISRCYYKDITDNGRRIIIVYSIHQMEQILRQKAFAARHGSLIESGSHSSTEGDLADGISAIFTNIMDVPANELIRIYSRRTDDLEHYRILSMEADLTDADLSRNENIRSHFVICFAADVVFTSFMVKMKAIDQGRRVRRQLREMDFMKIQSEGYIPLYTRTDLTDKMHEAIGFRTDFEIISMRHMNRLIRNKL